MDITDDEYEELRRLDQLRSNNSVLNAWLTIQHAEFPAWAEQAPGTWDFSLDSLVRLEDLIRSRYASVEQAHQDEGGDFLQTASWYVGEVHNRYFGTGWQFHPDSTEIPGAWPFVTVPFDRLFEFPDEDGIDPDGRPFYTPVKRLCGILTPDNGHLATDPEVYTPACEDA
ncbi:hypothetical protein Sgleb_36090 [Streptomyces glebosus]|uniref:Uncharacterized protein n=1 Tax=Streptomyces glebosus TaxID=249580 RepID=A0A640SXF5_9ACTN|nr:hypothetical protein [Streptomyces glebosus]GFE15562.1 hypothetical protein Sgleb_36090 [Streptomyces glebosus]GHG51467.1 hypothetical protein GCM10010513_10810 [Streptomyces glebosus]